MLDRTHIGIFGPRNAGKSSLINMLTNQQVSIVSDVAGTTTDPVSKPIEINGIGPCVFIDTPGYDDFGALGELRVTKTKEVLSRCDTVLFIIPDYFLTTTDKMKEAAEWFSLINSRTRSVLVVNRFTDCINDSASSTVSTYTKHGFTDTELSAIKKYFGRKDAFIINILKNEGRDLLLNGLGMLQSVYEKDLSIVTHLVNPGDAVILVMPQDIQAPKGRLILPQVQTIRELLDYGCSVTCSNFERIQTTIAKLAKPPVLIVTDSQVFKEVYALKPSESRLTSFSVLFARWKGDIDEYIKGVRAFTSLNKNSRVLIAEACTHAPLSEDIGREKIPALIHRNIDPDICIDIVSGYDWPDNISSYSLIIQCGACMFSRSQVLNRIAEVKKLGIPITNYGITIAYFHKMLDKIVW